MEYVKYLILFRDWKKSKCFEDHNNEIVERAGKFMSPSVTLKTNPKFVWLPTTTSDKATSFYVETSKISTNKLRKVNLLIC